MEFVKVHQRMAKNGTVKLLFYPFYAKIKRQTMARHINEQNERKLQQPELCPADIAYRFEVFGAVKQAPLFDEQIQETDRTNEIVYIPHKRALGVGTSNDRYRSRRKITTEHVALKALSTFLERAARSLQDNYEERMSAHSIQANLSFIGKKEFEEATAGIADYWKWLLDGDETLQIGIVTGALPYVDSSYRDKDGQHQIKSDEFVLDSILAHFSDEELYRYSERLHIDYEDIVQKATEAEDADHFKIVLLDDWMISGTQLRDVRDKIYWEFPRLNKSISIQLIAASGESIRDGLVMHDYFGGRRGVTPIRAYYIAREAPLSKADNHAHITGYHSSVDYGFEKLINQMTHVIFVDGGELEEMPPLTNIVRPYRQGEKYLAHCARVLIASAQKIGGGIVMVARAHGLRCHELLLTFSRIYASMIDKVQLVL
ncbi:MAG TPA: hypothetical protein PKD19_01485 [Candidatus Saccharibacteria bacterium]|nr:hypothetical protein [Candidatus Saccharibacteria bacterium]HMR38128.1 hypothetical protein [Candidatus Saccharibacteria bacterium]